jgi:hypothetical protein
VHRGGVVILSLLASRAHRQVCEAQGGSPRARRLKEEWMNDYDRFVE